MATARRAKAAGFDIIYVYATHDFLIHSFLSSKRNFRSDKPDPGDVPFKWERNVVGL